MQVFYPSAAGDFSQLQVLFNQVKICHMVSHFLPESSNSIMLAQLLLILEDLGSNPRTCDNLHWPGFEPTTPRVEGNQMRHTELSQGV